VTDARSILEHAYAELAKGNGRPFVDMLADDVIWEIPGSGHWSRTYRGKASAMADLIRPVVEQFDGPNRVEATRFIVDGNIVVVEGRNLSKTKRGLEYPNRYCFIFEMRDGQVAKVIEYCDTALVDRVLDWPGKGA
jgi:uncharacterized protein